MKSLKNVIINTYELVGKLLNILARWLCVGHSLYYLLIQQNELTEAITARRVSNILANMLMQWNITGTNLTSRNTLNSMLDSQLH